MKITQEILKNLLDYNKETGEFFWKYPKQGRKKNKIAGGISTDGYRVICIDGVLHKAHKLAWIISYGNTPQQFIDHINCCPLDNRLCNLREATQSQNNFNTRLHSNNTSGHKGVTFDKANNKWIAQIVINKKNKKLGRYSTLEEAVIVANEARNKLHGEYARLY